MAESERGSVTRMLDLARQGDDDAKVQLWERYRKLLYAMAHEVLGDAQPSGAADASDVVAEAGVRFFSTADLLENVRDRKHFQNLLRQILNGKGIDLLRRETARPAVPLPDESGKAPADLRVPDFVFLDFDDLLNALPLTLREAAMAYMDWGDMRDAAQALGITYYEFRIRWERIRDLWSKKLGG